MLAVEMPSTVESVVTLETNGSSGSKDQNFLFMATNARDSTLVLEG